MQRKARKANAWKSSLPGSASAHTTKSSTFHPAHLIPRSFSIPSLGRWGRRGTAPPRLLTARWSSAGMSLTACTHTRTHSPPSPLCPRTGTEGSKPVQQDTPWRCCCYGRSFPRPFPSSAKVLLYSSSPSANSGEQSCHQHTAKPFTSKGSHRLSFHLQLGKSLPAYVRLLGKHC